MIRTLVILAAVWTNVYADEPLSFKSLRIGSDKSTVLATLPGGECADKGMPLVRVFIRRSERAFGQRDLL
jgi:hypothetical protein